MNKLQPLKFVNLLELVERQKMLDVKFNEKNKNNSSLRPRNRANTLIALNTELGEVDEEDDTPIVSLTVLEGGKK